MSTNYNSVPHRLPAVALSALANIPHSSLIKLIDRGYLKIEGMIDSGKGTKSRRIYFPSTHLSSMVKQVKQAHQIMIQEGKNRTIEGLKKHHASKKNGGAQITLWDKSETYTEEILTRVKRIEEMMEKFLG